MKKTELLKYSSENNIHSFVIYETDDDIIEVESKGVITKYGFDKCVDFLFDYSETKGKKIKLLTINNNIEGTHPKARNVFLRLLKKNSPCEKLATVGDNIIIRSIIKLYSVLNRGDMKINSFKTKEEAVKWLNSNDG